MAKEVNLQTLLTTFEYICCNISSKGSEVVLLSIYRPGSKPATHKFLDELCSILEILSTYRRPILITGDINIRIERADNVMTVKFLEMLASFDLIVHKTAPTHREGGQLDLVISRAEMNDLRVSVHEIGVSDHCMLTFSLPIQKRSDISSTFSGRSWKDFDYDAFQDDLMKSELCCNLEHLDNLSTDEVFDQYSSILKEILDKHAPCIARSKKCRHVLTPWFDAECRALKRSTRRLERAYRRHHTTESRLVWVKSLQAMRVIFQTKEHEYWEARVAANHKSPKKLWKNLSAILSKNKSTTGMDCSITPDQFALFFHDKVKLVQSQTSTAMPPSIPVTHRASFEAFQLVTAEEIMKFIMAAPNKYCALDPAPTWLIKRCSNLVSPFVAIMCNRSIQEGHLPVNQKTALVTPLIKKVGLDPTELKNYRPVSNLSFISKLVERVVSKQINMHLSVTGSLPSHQSAYRQFHSTETALLKVVNDIAVAADDGQVSILSLLDLSAAFDTVDHKILIKRLENTHGICGMALEWLKSYLTGRTQCVVIGDKSSLLMSLDCGVPQGSVLGPQLFLLYTVEIMEIIHRHGLEGHCYADDTQTYIHCDVEDAKNIHLKLLPCIDDIDRWMASNRLKLNADKTEFIWIGPKAKLRRIQPDALPVSGALVVPANVVRNLGVYIDGELSMRDHINRLSRTCYFQLRQLRTVRRSLTPEATRLLLHSFVVSRLDYCNSLFVGLPSCTLSKLQLIQNAAARLFGGLRKNDHVSEVMEKKLHWLRIPERIVFKLSTLVYKSLHNEGPSYLSEQCVPVTDDNPYLSGHRSSSRGDLFVPRTQSATYGNRAFSVAGPSIWNSLPADIRGLGTLNDFKAKLKTFLFTKSYPTKS